MKYIQRLWAHHGKKVDLEEYHAAFRDAGYCQWVPVAKKACDERIFTCVFAEQLTCGYDEVFHFDVPFTRKLMACELAEGKLFNRILDDEDDDI
uniref:Uncharacterized protein n=1 Tax=Panagrolaimus sp. ES5 TaxID=591445 RepID=A0AC34FTG1_9BILA